MRDHQHRATDRLFARLLVGQWLVASVLAFAIAPWSFHFELAFGLGAVMNTPPLLLIHLRPGWWGTRQVVAVVQLLWSVLLIASTNGRLEMHFHVFGSLVFLAFYRDWRVLATGTMVVVVDHLARGLFWPDSLYGIANPEWWRFLARVAFVDIVLALGCRRSLLEMRHAATREARLLRMKMIVERTVDRRTLELQESSARYRSLVENAAVVPFELERSTSALLYMAPQMTRMLECSPHEIDVAFLARAVHPDDLARLQDVIERFRGTDAPVTDELDYRLASKTGRELHVRTLFSRVGERVHGYTFDITRQRHLELELAQAQKLESVGRLASGVAHEINTPVQFVGDSIQFASEAVTELFGVLEEQRRVVDAVLAAEPDNALAKAADAAVERADLPFLVDELPRSLERASDGLARVAAIVRSMKVFSHPGGEVEAVDLNGALESTLIMAHNEYRFVADLDARYGELPSVACRGGEISQVLLNLVVNAAHAMATVAQRTKRRGTLTVRTFRDGDSIAIAIGDTGDGIPPQLHDRIFDPFFTTKAVGQGTGQGLAIARTVVERHRGSLTFESTLGVGTVFTVRLPVDQAQKVAA